MDWDDVRHFLALARLGSVRAAGNALGVSHSTVSRRVEALEERLATRLFDRNRDGYMLTEAGRQMLPGAERVESEMACLERSLVGQDERLEGTISLTCCDEYVAEIMMRDLASLCDTCPGIELCMINDSRSFDLSKREADIAVRILPMTAQPPEYLIGKKVAPVVCANYVAIEHAHRLDPERAGTTPRWIAFDERKHVDALIAESSYPDVPAWGSFSSLTLMMQAVREGLGIAMLPCYAADQDPALRRLAKADTRQLADMWLLSHPDLRDNTRFQAAKACITGSFEGHQALFSGQAPQHAAGRSAPRTA